MNLEKPQIQSKSEPRHIGKNAIDIVDYNWTMSMIRMMMMMIIIIIINHNAITHYTLH